MTSLILVDHPTTARDLAPEATYIPDFNRLCEWTRDFAGTLFVHESFRERYDADRFEDVVGDIEENSLDIEVIWIED